MEHMLWVGEGVATKNKVKTRKSILKELSKIKPADMKRVAKAVLVAKCYNLAVIGPVTGKQEKQMSKLLGV